MSENLMNEAHKASNPLSRKNYDQIFGLKDDFGRNLSDKKPTGPTTVEGETDNDAD